MTYLETIASQLGVALWLLAVILVWSIVWKLLALWKSARKKQIIWFIVLAFINTIGILEILYIYVFSEMGKKPVPAPKRKARRKKRR